MSDEQRKNTQRYQQYPVIEMNSQHSNFKIKNSLSRLGRREFVLASAGLISVPLLSGVAQAQTGQADPPVPTNSATDTNTPTRDAAPAANSLAWDKTFPQSDRVDHQKVSFYNRLGIALVADLYVPKNLDRSGRHPTLVVGHPFGGVKE